MKSENNNAKLEKRLSPLNVWALALGCIIGWGAFVMPGNTFLVKSGTFGTAIAMGVAVIIMIVIALNYQFMIAKKPVAGGEFAYAEMAFGKTNGFICAWFLALSYLAIIPLNATALALIGRNLMGKVFQFGFHYVVAGYDIYMGEIILALAALVLFGVFSIKGVKSTGIFQNILTFSLVGGVLIVLIAAIISPHATWENVMSMSFSNSTGLSKTAGILAVVAVAPWAFVGFDTIPQAAEEFNFSHKKSKTIMIISIAFGGLIYVVLNAVTASVLPEGYSTYEAYLADLPNLTGLISLPTFYAANVLLGTPGLVIIGIAVLGAVLSGINGFYMATSRLLYSLAKESVIPASFGKLSKNNTPAFAIVFIMIISMIAPFFGRTALGWIVDMSSIGAAIGYGYTSASALKFAAKEKNKTVTITGLLGIIFAVIFCVLLLIPVKMFGCSLGKESYICLIIWVVLGVVFYFASRKKYSHSK